MTQGDPKFIERCINTIRFLAVDAVEAAQSGHPGAPLACAPLAFLLWDKILRYNPKVPNWPGRDRFVLSAGHGSMLLYAILYLTGYDLPLEEIKQFRQWESKTPGHPEFGMTPGVEVTTGPLGQGFANGVGMAIAQRRLATLFDRPGHEIIDHYIYALVSDGDLMEGVASEAASLAGTLGLGKLIYFYDDNEISIEGDTDLAFREEVGRRFEAYGWQVQGPFDGKDLAGIERAIERAQAEEARPSLIVLKTVIGYGSPEAGTAKVHGEALGEENVKKTKKTLGWPQEPIFFVPEDVLKYMRRAVARGQEAQARWEARLEAFAREHPEPARQLKAQLAGELPKGWDQGIAELFGDGGEAVATRNASHKVINRLAERVPALIGGSADLAPSTKTEVEGGGDFSAENPAGRNLHFGVREHAMGSIANGMARHGGIIPYTATFLIFSDYMRPAIRLAALMGVQVAFVFSHDSIGLGEDGPTHQPVEHIMSLRAIPNLDVIRPADAAETAEAWKAALMRREGPTALLLTRQKVPIIDRKRCRPAAGLHQGAYILWQSTEAAPEIILMATGSEVEIVLEAGERLAAVGRKVRVVSFPCWEKFEAQPEAYRESVLPSSVKARVSVEAGVSLGWERYVGEAGKIIGLDRFGASAPYKTILEHLGFTVEKVVEAAEGLLEGK